MAELRQNLATKEWFVIATERAKRPHDFAKETCIREDIEFSEKCPFCPGNEGMTPDESFRIEENGKWIIRAVPNKFSAFSPVGRLERQTDGIYRCMSAVGIHEVIIESPLHNDNITKMKQEHVESLIETYLNRYNAAMADPRIEVVILFKNYGLSAGSSLFHPHSQMIATPIVPTSMRNHLDAAKSYFDDNGQCAFCRMIEEETENKARVVLRNDSFVVICPYASGNAFESWIMPLRHTPSFGEINAKEIKDLASIMKDLFSRYYVGLNDPDFNYVIKTPPRDESNDRAYHWYIQMLPKLTKIAGFELGSGMYINVTLPEKNAEFLRTVDIISGKQPCGK